VALRGVLALLFGIAAFAIPAATMLALVIFLVAYNVLDGLQLLPPSSPPS
jgi:uncharacterized membrane protein HdeD (DUF308 family)